MSKKQQKRTQKLLDAGIDIIIGHGAHSIQKIERINGKWVLYNIGNFVFPSPGRYKKKKAYPYSLMVNLEGSTLKVYPIMTDNRVTNYKSHFLSKKR